MSAQSEPMTAQSGSQPSYANRPDVSPLFRLDKPPVLPLFDCNVNIGFTAEKPGFYARQTREAAEQEAGETNVCHALGGPASAGAYKESNAASIDWADGEARWLPMVRMRGSGMRPMTSMWSVRESMDAKRRRADMPLDVLESQIEKAAAIKMMPFAEGLPKREALDLILTSGKPILVHAGEMCSPSWVAKRLLNDLKGPLIFAHLGSWPCSAEGLMAAVDLARADERVFLETSGAWIGNFITYAAQEVPDKVLFGSNAPMCPVKVQWGHVASAIRDDAVLEKVAYTNAGHVFNAAISAKAAA